MTGLPPEMATAQPDNQPETTVVIVDPASRPPLPAPPPPPPQAAAPLRPAVQAQPAPLPPLPQTLSGLDREVQKLLTARKAGDALLLLERMQAGAPREARILPRIARVARIAGVIGKAEAAARQAIAAGVADQHCYVSLAQAARKRGSRQEAAALLDSALSLPGTLADLWMERLELAREANDRQASRKALEMLVNLIPENMTLRGQLARAVHEAGDPERAQRIARPIIRQTADVHTLQLDLGNLLQAIGMEEESLVAYDRAAALNPRNAGAMANKGAVLRRMGRLSEAMTAYNRALEADPLSGGAHYNKGNLLKSLGDFSAAVDSYDRSLAVDPNNGTVHWNKALALLASGDLVQGFREYEWRWRHAGFPTRPRQFSKPVWAGAPLNGLTLFVYSEQGQGDMFQFLRFVPPLKALGGRIILEVHDELFDFIAAQNIADVLIRRGDIPPDHDLQIPIGSLPHRLGTSLASLPSEPYLTPPADARSALPSRGEKPRVGLVWAGNPNFSSDADRSMRFEMVRPLLQIKSVEWVSLQKGYAETQIPAQAPILPLGQHLSDWSTTARTLQDIDLVISTCTSVPHLAGALGRPGWVMLSWDADWRWLDRSRRDSPWYPSLRLFRQPAARDWASVVEDVVAALRAQFGG